MAALCLHRVADAAGLERLVGALEALSAELGDNHAATPETLRRAILAAQPAAYGLLALRDGETAGAAMFSPVFSTVRGSAGLFVSDLWVAASQRGQGTGRSLLGEVARAGRSTWSADWMKLAVYDRSEKARAFYLRLGFVPVAGAREFQLDGAGIAVLAGEER